MPQSVTFDLPFPPSVNKYWRHVVIGGSPRTLLSARGRQYRIPDEVQDAGEEYAKAQEEFNRAKSKRDQKKEGLIELMVEHEVKRFPYRDGKKVFELDQRETVKIKKRTVDGSDDSDGPTA